jgi:hypothetical protein
MCCCVLLQWVNNLVPFKAACEEIYIKQKMYKRHKTPMQIKVMFDNFSGADRVGGMGWLEHWSVSVGVYALCLACVHHLEHMPFLLVAAGDWFGSQHMGPHSPREASHVCTV